MSKLPKDTAKRVREGARIQRDGKTEEEWFAHLIRTARTQEEILNLVVENQGPEGLEFRMQVRSAPGDSWADVDKVTP